MKLSDQKTIYTFFLLHDKRCWGQVWQLLIADRNFASRKTEMYALLHGDKDVREFVKRKVGSSDEKDTELIQWLLRECQKATASP